jgi:hypothetical protein
VAASYEFVDGAREIFLKQRSVLEKLTLAEFNAGVKRLFSGKKRLTCVVLPEKKSSSEKSGKGKREKKVSRKGK